jgi:two-component system sensor histidine kinase BaeS
MKSNSVAVPVGEERQDFDHIVKTLPTRGGQLIRPGITTKLFLTLIATIFVVIGVLLWWVNWSFDRGFVRYINLEDERRTDIVAIFLEDQYRLNSNWDFIRGQDRNLRQIARDLTGPTPGAAMGMGQGRRGPVRPRGDVTRTELFQPIPEAQGNIQQDSQPPEYSASPARRPRGPGGMAEGANMGARPPPPRGIEGLLLPERLSLYDANDEIVAQNVIGERGLFQRALYVDGLLVGTLWLLHQERITDDFDIQFSDQQTQANILIALALFGFSIIVSLLLSRNLVGTVKQVATGARELAAGNWESRIAVESSDELGQLARDFNDLAKTLEANEQSRRQWIADISHELRTPITILIGEIEAIIDGARSATPSALRSLHDEANRMKNLVGDLYHLSLSDIGALDYRKTWVQLHDIVQDAIHHFTERFTEAGIQLKFDSPSGQYPKLYGDPDRLYQLISNLLQNSARYTDRGGLCRVQLQELSDGLLLQIEDSAPSVPDDALPKLFDRLFRVESSRNRATGGAGLGLAICANIISGHDGEIEAAHSTLGGLKLSIYFPYRSPLS